MLGLIYMMRILVDMSIWNARISQDEEIKGKDTERGIKFPIDNSPAKSSFPVWTVKIQVYARDTE